MLVLLIYVVITCLVAVGLVKVIDKFLPASAKKIVSFFLWIVCIALSYLIYASVMKPIKFNEEKETRFEVAVRKLIDIKKAQQGYKTVNGKYADSFDELVAFIESEKFAIISRKDTAVIDAEKNRAFGITTD